MNPIGHCEGVTQADRLSFDFRTCALLIWGDGSARVTYTQSANSKADPENKNTSISTPRNIGYLANKFQRQYKDLGYGIQDETIRRIGNAEHTALHLWVAAAQDDDILRAPHSSPLTRREKFKQMELDTGLNEHILLEGFVTNIQLLSNGIHPTIQSNEELESACVFLGLELVSITAALAFVQYFRAEFRRCFQLRIQAQQATNELGKQLGGDLCDADRAAVKEIHDVINSQE